VLGESLYSSSAYFLFSGSAHGFRVFLRVYSLSLAAHPAALAGFAALIYPCLEVVFAYPHAPYFVDCLPVAKPAPVAHIITPMAAIPLT